MKIKLSLLLLLLLSLSSQAATVTGYFTDGQSNAVNTVLVWRGVSATYGIGSSNVVFQSRFNMPVTNGIPTNNANIQGGLYYVFNPTFNVTVPVLVPTNNAVYQFNALITNLPSFSIWTYINATNVIVAGDTNLSISVNLANGPTWTISLTNVPFNLITNALGYTPVPPTYGGVTNALGYAPADTNNAAFTNLVAGISTNANALGVMGSVANLRTNTLVAAALVGQVPLASLQNAVTNNNAAPISFSGPLTLTSLTSGFTNGVMVWYSRTNFIPQQNSNYVQLAFDTNAPGKLFVLTNTATANGTNWYNWLHL